MQSAEPISSIDPRAFVAQVRQTSARRAEASVATWRTWMETKLPGLLLMSDSALEARPDTTAWMFPLSERSRTAPFAPIINRNALRIAVQADPLLRYALVKAWRRMLLFYGLTIVDDRIQWLGARYWWSRKASAHDRRISRMLRCMHNAGVSEQSGMLIAFLEAECSGVPERVEALAWWRSQLAN